MYYILFEVPRIDKFIETESRIVVIRGWGEVLMGIEFLIEIMKEF